MAGTATRQEQLPVFSSHPGCLALFGSRGALVAGTCRYRLALPIMPYHAVGNDTSTDAAKMKNVVIHYEYDDSVIADVQRHDAKDTATQYWHRV